MTLQANSNGVVTGKFTVPANVPAGTKRVTFTGDGGSHGDAVFIGQGTQVVNVNQIITTITNNMVAVVTRVDPIAQTFTLDVNQQLTGVDLWFTAKGTSSVEVRIQETSVGFPTQVVLARSRLPASSINVSGATTRFNFAAPVSLQGGTEYAIVVLCNDAVTACSIAELGKWDTNSGKWVTSQPYQVGVLLSSSNASTWSASQDKDLAFRLIRTGYSVNSTAVNLGSVAVTNATDLMVRATVGNPSGNTNCDFTLTFPDGSTMTVSAEQPIRLNSPITGNVTVTANLRGNATESPVLYSDVALLHGTGESNANYVTRAVPAGTNVVVTVVVDAYLPGSSSLAVEIKGVDSADNWASISSTNVVQLGDGWVELTFKSSSITESMVHAQLLLSGNSQYRPQVKNLRMMVA
jgi:hypothetical protein